MKKALLICLFFPFIAGAQLFPAYDSTTVPFSLGSSLSWSTANPVVYPSSLSTITVDTAGAKLWRIGNTVKSGFVSDTVASRGIMTDTVHVYQSNENDFFVVKVLSGINFSVNFWHTYQTDSLHAGGMVEYSTDSGATWMNVASCWDILTENFYTTSDSIFSGDLAFTGNSHGQQLSSLYVQNCIGEKSTTTSCMPFDIDGPIVSFYFRFRFVSDSTVDALAGWKIDSIELVNHICLGAVPVVQQVQNIITLAPNPVYDVLTITGTQAISSVAITNLLGQVVYSHSYNGLEAQVHVAGLPKGIYLVKINGVETRKFLKE